MATTGKGERLRILIVEDDTILGDGLKTGLQMHGFTTDLTTTLANSDAALMTGSFAAIVLDVMLPDGSGFDLIKTLRLRNDRTPILLLTALDALADRIDGLDRGADDHLGKPFALDEVAARLRALIRRAGDHSGGTLHWKGICLDPARLTAAFNQRPQPLSRREFTILHALMERPGTILSRAQLEDRLYGFAEGIESNAVEVHVHHLRAKFGREIIETVRGVGYRMAAKGP